MLPVEVNVADMTAISAFWRGLAIMGHSVHQPLSTQSLSTPIWPAVSSRFILLAFIPRLPTLCIRSYERHIRHVIRLDCLLKPSGQSVICKRNCFFLMQLFRSLHSSKYCKLLVLKIYQCPCINAPQIII